MLFIGLSGTGMQQEWVAGSVTAGLLAKSSVPLVFIPADSQPGLSDQLQLILHRKPEYCNPGDLQLLAQIWRQISTDKPVME